MYVTLLYGSCIRITAKDRNPNIVLILIKHLISKNTYNLCRTVL